LASPQVEAGHLQIANDLWEAIARQRLSGGEFRILLGILRKLYGFKRKSDWISNRQLAKMTGVTYNQAAKMVGRLSERGIVTLVYLDEGQRRIVKFNKDYDKWNPLPKKETVAQKGKGPLLKKENPPCRKRKTTKESITKETYTKEIREKIFDAWNSHPNIRPKHRVLNKATEQAINARLEQFTPDEVCTAIKNYGDSTDKFWIEWREVKRGWSLEQFLSRGEGAKVDKFLDGPICKSGSKPPEPGWQHKCPKAQAVRAGGHDCKKYEAWLVNPKKSSYPCNDCEEAK